MGVVKTCQNPTSAFAGMTKRCQVYRFKLGCWSEVSTHSHQVRKCLSKETSMFEGQRTHGRHWKTDFGLPFTSIPYRLEGHVCPHLLFEVTGLHSVCKNKRKLGWRCASWFLRDLTMSCFQSNFNNKKTRQT